MGTPLILGDEQKAQLENLRALAAQNVINMPAVAELLKTQQGKRQHMDQMNEQSIAIPMGFLVTFSIEVGHPVGMCRHMYMSVMREGRAPNPEAVWMVCEELGFQGDLSACHVYKEDLQRGDERAIAVNVIQPLNVQAEAQG